MTEDVLERAEGSTSSRLAPRPAQLSGFRSCCLLPRGRRLRRGHGRDSSTRARKSSPHGDDARRRDAPDVRLPRRRRARRTSPRPQDIRRGRWDGAAHRLLEAAAQSRPASEAFLSRSSRTSPSSSSRTPRRVRGGTPRGGSSRPASPPPASPSSWRAARRSTVARHPCSLWVPRTVLICESSLVMRRRGILSGSSCRGLAVLRCTIGDAPARSTRR
jgi:hypothetical protein